MTARERVLTSRLIEKISKQEEYAQKIGLTVKTGEQKANDRNNKSSERT